MILKYIKGKVGIAIGVVTVLFILCSLATWGAYTLLGKGLETIEGISTDLVTQACEDYENFSAESFNFDQYFTQSYLDENTEAEAKEALDQIFSTFESCDSLSVSNVMDLIDRNHDIEIQTNNGNTTAIYSFDDADGERVTIELQETAEGWKIEEVR